LKSSSPRLSPHGQVRSGLGARDVDLGPAVDDVAGIGGDQRRQRAGAGVDAGAVLADGDLAAIDPEAVDVDLAQRAPLEREPPLAAQVGVDQPAAQVLGPAALVRRAHGEQPGRDPGARAGRVLDPRELAGAPIAAVGRPRARRREDGEAGQAEDERAAHPAIMPRDRRARHRVRGSR
jgi:hypothetical protein